MRKKQGYSILEIVLVMGAIALITGAVFNYYNKQRQEAQIRETVQQIDTIFDSGNDYLINLKADGSNQDRNKISMQILKNMNTLSINLGEFTEQEILVDTLPTVQVSEPETNESLNQPEEPETVPETPSTPETPIVDNASNKYCTLILRQA